MKKVINNIIPIPITLLSAYLAVSFTFKKYISFIPSDHEFEINLLLYSAGLSSLWMLLGIMWGKISLKVAITYSTNNKSFISSNKIHADFKKDTSTVYLKVKMDGTVKKLSNLSIKIVLPKKVKSQKTPKNIEFIELNETKDVIIIPLKNIINDEKLKVSSELFYIPILLIKDIENVDSYVETTIQKNKIQFVKCKFTKNKLKLL